MEKPFGKIPKELKKCSDLLLLFRVWRRKVKEPFSPPTNIDFRLGETTSNYKHYTLPYNMVEMLNYSVSALKKF